MKSTFLSSLILIDAIMAAQLPAPAHAQVSDVAIEEATIADLEAAYAAGRTTARAVTEAYLDRIAAYDKRGPLINSLITINPRALEDADQLDAALRASGRPVGPLHGIPVIVKDNIDVAGLPMTSGFQGWKNYYPPEDAPLVKKIRAAGGIILGMLYESYIHPLTILSTLPSAGVGAVLALRAGQVELSVMGIIAIILLIGIVKKNGIMLVDFAITAERGDHMTPVEAIRQACLMRFRPILMTTAAAMMAGVPLALGHGTGAELRQPLGYAMVGGLALSQLLTLYTTPVVYLYLDRLQSWLKRDAAARSQGPEETRTAAVVPLSTRSMPGE
jgi:hypothetical protein